MGRRLIAAAALSCTLATLAPAVLSAQMGGGGMGGGMGGRGGGMSGGMGGGGMGGRGGGPGGGRGGGTMTSPADMARDNLKQADPIAFLLDRKKPLDLTKAQSASLKALRKEMQRTQQPLFKSLEQLSDDRPPRGQRGGGMGGGAPGGAPGDMPGGAPDTVRALIGRLADVQDSFRDRAREQLSEMQRTRADSLMQVRLADERARSGRGREQRTPRR
ncbi:MAG: hypothetical protein P3B76_04890 [Gemmatimonadota bacterium]|nr:hypothetical protein [Gemmatimonadota bacterium]MDQ8167206.1 hypothetical protein [Gemmatimonadota bacterium]MDQ8172003.1 hypothetical protein [Gemmatimonadota bacterium]